MQIGMARHESRPPQSTYCMFPGIQSASVWKLALFSELEDGI